MEAARVRVATCSDAAEAAMVRAILDAHDIEVVIAGEHNASMLVGLAGSYVSLDVYVDAEDSERAAELIRSLREGGEGVDEPPDDDGPDIGPDPHAALETRKRTGVVVVLALCITFGTAHMYARAWMRGIALAAIELVGIGQIGNHRPLGVSMIVGAILCDLIGALYLVRRRPPGPRPDLPTARLRS
jgi:hypothetical protein